MSCLTEMFVIISMTDFKQIGNIVSKSLFELIILFFVLMTKGDTTDLRRLIRHQIKYFHF